MKQNLFYWDMWSKGFSWDLRYTDVGLYPSYASYFATRLVKTKKPPIRVILTSSGSFKGLYCSRWIGLWWPRGLGHALDWVLRYMVVGLSPCQAGNFATQIVKTKKATLNQGNANQQWILGLHCSRWIGSSLGYELDWHLRYRGAGSSPSHAPNFATRIAKTKKAALSHSVRGTSS